LNNRTKTNQQLLTDYLDLINLTHSPSYVREARRLLSTYLGSPHWKHSELFFEKKALIPALQQLLIQTNNAL
jgi:hypothetical protein